MSKRRSVSELTRLAFIGAERDSASLADAWPVGSEQRKEALSLASQFLAYRMKRWGMTQLEAKIDEANLISVYEMVSTPNLNSEVQS